VFVGFETLKLGVKDVAITFNEWALGRRKILELDVPIGENTKTITHLLLWKRM
jgi:hypothetical protein